VKLAESGVVKQATFTRGETPRYNMRLEGVRQRRRQRRPGQVLRDVRRGLGAHVEEPGDGQGKDDDELMRERVSHAKQHAFAAARALLSDP
jgi:hypothetical protein